MNRKSVNSKEELNKILELHNQGYLNREIANIMGTSASTIARRLQKMDVKSRHPKMTPDREKAIVECYKKELNINKVCKLMSVSSSTVATLLKKNNISTLTRSQARQIYTLNENYFDSIDTANKAYIFGLLYADGCVDNEGSKNGIHLSLQESDVTILNKILVELETNRPLRFIDYKKKNLNFSNQYSIDIVNKHMHSQLISLGMIPNKSLTFKMPTSIKENFISDFIRGYFDGDGSIAKNEARISLVGTKMFFDELKPIIEDILGIHCSIMLCHRNNESPMRTLGIAGKNQVKTFLDWLYSDSELYIERKKKLYQEKYC